MRVCVRECVFLSLRVFVYFGVSGQEGRILTPSIFCSI